MLALTYERNDINAEQLWERSLIALGDRLADDETARVLAARANLHLHRRPYAIKLLEDLASLEATALAALANGNLPKAEKSIAAIKPPLAALVGALELEQLRVLYGSGATAGFEKRRSAILERHDAYSTLLYAPLSSGDWFHAKVHNDVIKELEALGVDFPGRHVGSFARLPRWNVGR